MGKPNVNINVGAPVGAGNKHKGTTEERPAEGMLVGFQYFDTTLGKPIWYNGITWIDATGTEV